MRPIIEAHNLELVQRNVMQDVETDIYGAMLEAVEAESPDWPSIQKIIGKPTTDKLMRVRKKSKP